MIGHLLTNCDARQISSSFLSCSGMPLYLWEPVRISNDSAIHDRL